MTSGLQMLAAALAFSVTAVSAQNNLLNDWTPQEQQWANEARALYQKQGLSFTDEQAGAAIREMRSKNARGIPPSKWTPMERQLVSQMREYNTKNGLPFTDEQAQISVQQMREKMARISGQFAALQMLGTGQIPKPTITSAPPPYLSSTGVPTEEQLAAQLAQIPQKTDLLDIKDRRDGFEINGRPYVDSEGPIRTYAFDVITGDITYITQSGAEHVIKVVRAGTNTEPIRIGVATRSAGGKWEVTTVTGKKLSGESLTAMPFGVLVSRDTSAFLYTPGKGVRSVTLPRGYTMAQIQRGNVGSTGFVLVEKEFAETKVGGLTGFANAFKSLGATFGVNTKEDYALMNIENGKMFPLNIQADGKHVTQLSNCTKRNVLVNDCKSSRSFESMHNPDGSRNINHYYWKAIWMNTPSGPIAITMENGVRDLYLLDLASGKKVSGFSRGLGIQDFVADQSGDGKVAIKARWMFETHEISDAVAHLKNSPDVSVAPVTTATANVNQEQ